MQRLTTRVQAQRTLALARSHVGNVDMQAQVGIGHRDIRSTARFLLKLVYDSILHLIAHELRVAKLLREHHRIYRKSMVIIQIFAPVDSLDALIHIIGAQSLKASYGL